MGRATVARVPCMDCCLLSIVLSQVCRVCGGWSDTHESRVREHIAMSRTRGAVNGPLVGPTSGARITQFS